MIGENFIENILGLIITTLLMSLSKAFVAYVLTERFTRWRNKVVATKPLERKIQISLFKLIYYISAVILGISVLASEKWALRLELPGVVRPTIPLKFRVYYYYEMAYYINELMTIIYEPKMKDSLQMTIHHLVTLMVMYLSLAPEFINYGVVILLLHDISDPRQRPLRATLAESLLECAKIEHYMNNEIGAGVMIFTFTTIFMISRLLLYPRYILYVVIMLPIDDVRQRTATMMIIIACLSALQVMHVIWSFFIGMLFSNVIKGSTEKDPCEIKNK